MDKDAEMEAILKEAFERAKTSRRPVIATLTEMVHAAREKNLLVRHGWKLPDPPTCSECGAPGRPCAYDTGEGWSWGWECSAGCGPDYFWWSDDTSRPGTEIPWPFAEEWAHHTDWEKVGFEVA